MDLIASVYRPPRARAPWELSSLLAGGETRLFALGRHALACALRCLGAKRALLPEFFCREVLSSFAAAGCEVVYYPVDERLDPASSPESWPDADAVLAVDFFGFPQDLAPFRRYARRAAAAVIEDAAHALFSRDAEGRLLGTRGDAGVFSLRKSLAIPSGAALWRPAGKTWALEPQEPLTGKATPRQSARQTARHLAAAGPRALHGALVALRAGRAALTGRRIPGAHEGCETEALPESKPWAGLARPIAAGDPELEVARRRELYALIARTLSGCAAPVFPELPAGAAPYGYPFRPVDEAECRRRLAALGLEPLGWPELPAAVEPRAPAHYRDVRLVHFLW